MDGPLTDTQVSTYREQGYPQSTLSTALVVDDCTPEHGPLHVWPGSHAEHVEHEPTPGEGAGRRVPPGELDGDGRDALAPAGSALVFNSLLVHSFWPNTSGAPRRLLIWSHYPDGVEGLYAGERMAPQRLRESPHEWTYQRLTERGEYPDRFGAP
jgi:ectoine hydroxylase-related dioxygenase (phytanoyl-CoA dioxygenase family)